MEVFGVRTGAIPDWLDNILVERPKKSREQLRDLMSRDMDKNRNKGGAYYGLAYMEGTAILSLHLVDILESYAGTLNTPITAIRNTADYLRLGEGFQKGGWGIAEDSLRLFGLIGPVVGKAVPLLSSMLVAGGPNSCAFTATMKAVRLGGRRLFAPLSALTRNFKMVKIPETGLIQKLIAVSKGNPTFANKTGETLKQSLAVSKKFKGATIRNLKDDFLRPLRVFKEHEMIDIKLKNFSDVVDVVKNGEGVVLIDYSFKFASGQGGHVIAVHKTSKGVRFADQLGSLQTLEEISENAAKYYLAEVDSAAKAGIVIEDVIVQEARVFEAKNNPIRFLDDSVSSIEDAVLLKNSVFLPYEQVPLMLRHINPHSFLNQLAVPVFEFSWNFFESLAQKHLDRTAPTKPPLANYPIKQTKGLTQRMSNGGKIEFNEKPEKINEYTVNAGDTLNGIAIKFYGTPAAVGQIQSANWDLKNHSPLMPIPAGWKIVIP